jgi:hypothetical protein
VIVSHRATAIQRIFCSTSRSPCRLADERCWCVRYVYAHSGLTRAYQDTTQSFGVTVNTTLATRRFYVAVAEGVFPSKPNTTDGMVYVCVL